MMGRKQLGSATRCRILARRVSRQVSCGTLLIPAIGGIGANWVQQPCIADFRYLVCNVVGYRVAEPDSGLRIDKLD